ncbi:MAG: hypothetical protein ABIQ16_23150 [Polyangiaceae bacterium]
MAEDPVRLFDESGSELLKSLLSAAREEQPQPAAVRRTLTAVGVGSAVIATAGTASAVTAGAEGVVGAASLGSAKGVASATLPIVVKFLGAGAIAGIVATSAIYAVSVRTLPAPKPVSAATGKVTAPVIVTRARSDEPPAAPEAHAEPQPSAALAVVPPAPLTSVVAPVPQPLSVPAEVDPTAQLAAELALLDSARQALATGNAARALRSLNDYDVRFEHPNLAPEALYIRLEALTLQGDRPGTEAVARRLLHSYPTGPHAARARAVLGLDR